MKDKLLQFFKLALFLLLGLTIAFQIKTIKKQTIVNNRQKNLENLKQLLKEEKQNSLTLEQRIKEYEKKVNKYETKYIKGNKIENLKDKLDHARLLAGLTNVTGPGVIIKMDDSKKRISEGMNPNDTVIHDSQLINIVNLLRAAGAEAISINDERLVATSEIQCAGPTVSVNDRRYTVPFIIKAIGNADYLEAKLKESGNILDVMCVYGIQISIKKKQDVNIPKYRDLQNNKVNIVQAGD